MDNLSIEVGNGVHLRATSSYIRLQVFVLERSLALSDEFDQKDQSDTIYSVLFEEALPVATARFLQEDERVARIGRVATLKDYRGKQLGSRVVNSLEALAKEKQIERLLIHAEITAAGFYEGLGYCSVGKPYDEDGVPCITLEKQF
ncbi:GNAT family N-acetyltransferase [Enterococcus avium]|uniref:GNAT family N-acetyltransferase n=1 Tax=Enterococcus avium TaxID=33945 RepID=UPI00159D27AD|nr:GNAT family N-acetyltransferase [Enterococcus avium]NVN77708.1 GNAT family N-acetyltransferase [Enterococcus avium]